MQVFCQPDLEAGIFVSKDHPTLKGLAFAKAKPYATHETFLNEHNYSIPQSLIQHNYIRLFYLLLFTSKMGFQQGSFWVSLITSPATN